ncbi:DUF6691 family protein [Oceanicella actignis]|uniref:Sulphur transport domain-containing protein n=1 Tax=Oceanicella actignis TaxID=1189325 RepID=A0A1M7RT54_9RHOB|nr:DUF6691 family protein [Oceanicella actignis]SET05095.1 hypothetical protein SAMN04488119_102420 [Oceanicella actignis]SHN49374.1 hypothetical protein SAMN05216200_10198 [Oceanicella actignis]
MRKLVSFLSGLIFGLGLMISDMVNPARVLAFLDLAAIPAGAWDPTLIFVMGGAMIVSAAAWAVAARRREAALGGPIPAPRQGIDWRLLTGSAIFGVGWGLVGICPGPAIVGMAVGGAPSMLFVAAMIAGMIVYRLFDAALARRAAA